MSHKKLSTKAAKDAALEDMKKLHVNYLVFYTAKQFRAYPKEVLIPVRV